MLMVTQNKNHRLAGNMLEEVSCHTSVLIKILITMSVIISHRQKYSVVALELGATALGNFILLSVD